MDSRNTCNSGNHSIVNLTEVFLLCTLDNATYVMMREYNNTNGGCPHHSAFYFEKIAASKTGVCLPITILYFHFHKLKA